MSRLVDLAVRYCCDKYYAHSYVPFYWQLFDQMKVRKLLELGIGYEDLMTPFVPKYIHGASLKMWRDYFPEAAIYGCDIRPDTLFHLEDRIYTFECDQSSPTSLLDLVGFTGGDWDVVIDDGSHQTEHQILTAKTLLPYVAAGGVYVVEDVREPEHVAKAIGGTVCRFNKRDDDVLVVIRK